MFMAAHFQAAEIVSLSPLSNLESSANYVKGFFILLLVLLLLPVNPSMTVCSVAFLYRQTDSRQTGRNTRARVYIENLLTTAYLL